MEINPTFKGDFTFKAMYSSDDSNALTRKEIKYLKFAVLEGDKFIEKPYRFGLDQNGEERRWAQPLSDVIKPGDTFAVEVFKYDEDHTGLTVIGRNTVKPYWESWVWRP